MAGPPGDDKRCMGSAPTAAPPAANTARFESGAFNVTERRDYFINDCCYGDDLARWLKPRLEALGYQVIEPGQEDWGWYLECTRDGAAHSIQIGFVPDEGWQLIIERFNGLWKRLLGKALPLERQLALDLHRILSSSPEVKRLRWLSMTPRGSETAERPSP
jgi:hypothetical protein